MPHLVPTNLTGHTIGEAHHSAKYPDALVKQVRDMHELENLGYHRIARKLALKRDWVRHVCIYRIRQTGIAGWRKVKD
jgi:hypothetical protein